MNEQLTEMPSDSSELQTELIGLLTDFTNTDFEIVESHHIMNDLDLDSVKVMELLMELEDHFDISIPLNSLPDVNTVGDLALEISKLKNPSS